MKNPLQEQLLKAGLVKKSKMAEVLRQQARQRQSGASPAEPRVDAAALQAERAERDRALAAERNAQVRAAELRAQVRQIVDTHALARAGEIPYRFQDGDAIRSVPVDASQRAQLASGALVIVRHGPDYALLPRAAADKVHARDPGCIVVDHARAAAPTQEGGDDDAYYSRFEVPDDLVW